jgi:hypothetical protein
MSDIRPFRLQGVEKMKNKRLFVLALAALMVYSAAGLLLADNTDDITVNYEVTAINELEITGASATLTINSATGDGDPIQATVADTCDISTNCATDAKKITGAINTNMPSGLTLQVNMTAPTGANSEGAVTMTDAAAPSPFPIY